MADFPTGFNIYILLEELIATATFRSTKKDLFAPYLQYTKLSKQDPDSFTFEEILYNHIR